MTSLFSICLSICLFFVLTNRGFSRDDVFFKKYVSLIYNVHKYYGTSGVFFLFSRNERHLQEYTVVHYLSRDLSEKGVFSLVLNIEELDERKKFYRGHIVRPLVVALLRAMSDVAEFDENTRGMDKSYPIWLMIFHDKVGKPLCEYCGHPPGNILHLRFDTQMVVSCCGDPMVKEWWSVDGNHTEISNFGMWTENEGLTSLVPRGVYARRHNVNGAGLRIAIVANTRLGQSASKKSISYFGDVLMELKRAMNFTIILAPSVDTFGSFNSVTNNWTGAVGQVVRRQIDIGVGEFTMTNSRLNVIDFTLPLLLTRTRLYVKQPDGSGVQWSAYFQAFTHRIWMTIIVLLITSSILLTVIKMVEKSGPSKCLIVENYLCVWGLFCQQGLFKFPAETPLRIAFFSILVSAVVVFTAYSASLTSFLTVSSATLTFGSLAGFVNDGSYKLIVIQNSSNYDFFATSNDRIVKKMFKMMKPWKDLPKTFKEGFEEVCKDRVAFYTNSAVKKIMNKYLLCKTVSIETERVDSLAMAMAADNQYNGVVDYHLQRFQDNGLLNRMKQKYIHIENPPEATYDVVSLWGVAPILTVLAGGIILAIIILCFEKIYFYLKSCEQKCERSMYSNVDRIFTVHGKQQSSLGNLHLPIYELQPRRSFPHK